MYQPEDRHKLEANLGSVLGSIALFTLFHKSAVRGLGGVSRFIGRNAGRLIRGLGTPAAEAGYKGLLSQAILRSSTLSKWAGGPATSMADLSIGRLARPLAGELLGLASSRSTLISRGVSAVQTGYRQIRRERLSYFSQSGLRGLELRRAMRGQFQPRDMDMRRRLLSGYFKADGGFSKRFMGSALAWSAEYAKTVPGLYIADQALGLFSEERRKQAPAWYNIPGHLAGMVRFGVAFAPTQLAFKGFGAGVLHSKDALSESARKFISRRPGSRQTIHKLFSTEGMIGNVRATTLAFGQAVVERQRMGWGVSLQPLRFRGSAYNVFDMVNRAIKLRKEIGKPTFGVEREMKQILDQIQAVKTNVNVDPELFRVASESSPIREAFGRLTSKYTRAPKKSMLAHALGYESKAKTTFQFIDEYAKKSGWSAAEAGEIRKMVGEKKLYLGTNIMEQGNFGMLSAAYATEALTSMIGRASVPVIGWAPWERWARQRKMGAFEVIDDQRSILQATDHPLRGIDRVAKPHQGEVYLRVGDTMFSVAPYNALDPVRPLGPPEYKGRGKMLYLTSGERAHLVGSTEITTDQKKGWFSRVKQRFELGQDQSFVGRKLGRWLTRDFDPRSPHVLTGPGGRLEGMLKSSESLTPETLEEFKTYVGMIRRTFQGGQSKAFEILDREGSLRNKVLDIIGVPEARRTFRDNQMESMFTELRGMLNSPSDIRSPNAERLNRQIDRAMGMVGSSADAGYQWHSRASSVSESNAITTGAWLKGQYFTKLLEGKRSLKSGQIHPKLLERLYKSVDEASLSRRDTTLLKSLFTGTSFEGSLSKLESTSKGLAPIDMFSDLRSTVLDHWEAIQGAFSKPQIGRSPFATLYDSNSRIMNELGSGTADNRLWLMGSGRKAVIPGFFDDFKKMILGQPSGGPEPYVTQNSLRLNRWAISPMNRTLGFVGLDLSYSSNADFLRKFAAKRLLAIPAAIYGYRALDAAVAATPFLNHTIFEDGTTSAGADIIAKANLLRAGLFDKVGITSAAQYLEGLFPGSIESPAAKILRGAFPLFLGKAIGGRTGFFMGAGLSTMTGFGLPDLTRTHDELSDIYSGKELVPVRKGRFWELCITDDALVRTPNGLIPAKDISIGDRVFDKRGNETTVVDTAARNLEKDEHVFEIVPKYFPEFPLRCTGDHTIYVSRRGREVWVKTCDIQPGDHLLYPLRKFDSGLITDTGIDIPTTNLYELGRLIGIHTGIGRVNETHLDLEFNEYQLDVALSVSALIERIFAVDPELISTTCGYILRCEKNDISGLLWTITRFGSDETIEKFYHASVEFRNGFLCGLIEVCGGMDQEDRLHLVLERKRQNVTIFIIDALLSIGVIPEHTSIELFVDGKDRIFDRLIVAPEYMPYIVPKCRYMRLDLPDEFPSKNLKEVYTRAEVLYHPIKECRRIQYTGCVYDFWVGSTASFCAAFGVYHNSKGPFAGGKITSWVPSWYTRIKSQYRYTDTALGSKTEALLYTGPLSLLGATDPYHYERCVARGTPVVTSDGIRSVENISKNDIVLTHDGSYRKVLGAWSKLIDEAGVSFYSISLPTTTTPEHRYYTISPSGKYAWERADQLTTKHWMVMPRPKYRDTPRIDLLSYFSGYKHDKGHIYKGGHSLRRWIILDEQFGLFIGLYMRKLEGGAKAPFRAAAKGNESPPINSLIQRLSWHCFGIALDKLVDNRLYLEFVKRFGNTGHPQFPNEMLMANRDFMCGLLKGVLAEYAGYSPKKSYWTQRHLVLNVLHILLSFGVYAGVDERGGRYEFVFPETQTKNIRALFSNKIYVPISDNDVHFTENEIHFRVQKVKKELYTGKIYDLQVDGSCSFVGDCCSFHNTRYNERPYPLTAPPFHNVPVIGSILNTTVGRIVKPQQLMHEDELDAAYLGMNSADAEGLSPGINGPQLPSRSRGPNGAILGKTPIRTTSLSYAYGESLYRFTEAIGLRGFLAQTALSEDGANDYQPVYEDASSITSHAKQFWDLQVGGMGGLSEGLRRFYPRSRTRNLQNPIRNCLTNDSWIRVNRDTSIRADEVRIGDNLSSMTIPLSQVEKIFIREVQNEKIYRIYLNTNIKPSGITSEHPVYAIKSLPCSHRRQQNQICWKGRTERCSACGYNDFNENRYGTHKHYLDYKPEWIEAKDLKKGDWVGYIVHDTDETLLTIDLATLLGNIMLNPKKQVNRPLYEYDDQKIWTTYGANKPLNDRKQDRFLTLDYRFGYLCGLWLSEGSKTGGPGQFYFALHSNERETLGKELEDILQEYKIITNYYINGNALRITANSRMFLDILTKLFGRGSLTKHIPGYIISLAPKKFLAGILHGMFEGDGSISGTASVLKLSSASRNLILSTRDILLQFRIVSSIHEASNTGNGIYILSVLSGSNAALSDVFDPTYGYKIPEKIRSVTKSCTTNMPHWFDGNILFMVIRKIEIENYSGPLYDYYVPDGNSFHSEMMLLHNSQPTWLPSEFQYGDPIGRIDNGLLLLPSKAYETTHSVRHTFPMAIDYLGYDPRESALRYIGLERGDPVEVHQEGPMREYIQAQLAKANILTAKDIPVFSPASKLDGHIDAMVRMETGGTAPMQIKASTAERIGGMTQPLPAHASQINFLMRMAKKRIGQITYVAADNPDLQKTFTIEYSQERYRNDMERVDQARVLASGMLKNGIGYAGESYSYPDRLVALSNIAPTSPEYKETLKKVQALQKYGQLDDEDQRKVDQAKRIRNSILRQYDMYPRRFSFGKIMTPSSEYNLMSENRNIKAASEYSLLERALGGVWESFTSTQIPFVSRFYGTMAPEEMYKNAVFGSTSSSWAHPVRDFVNPATQLFLQSNDPIEGARKLGLFGALVGGPPGALVGVGAGALYGALRSPFSAGVPAGVQKTRDVTTYFDAIKYVKGMQAYSQTGDPAYLDDAKSTVFGLDAQSSTSQLYEAIPYKERPFLWTFAKTQDMAERRKILKMVSPTMARVLQFIWNDKKGKVSQDIVEYTARNEVPARSWEGWNAGVPVEDVELVSLEHEGLNSYDYGVGWHDQRAKMHNTYIPKPISLSTPSGMSETPEVTVAALRRTLSNLLGEYGIRNVSINVIEGAAGSTIVNLLLKV